MYKKNLFKKSLVIGIVILFIGAGFTTGINGKINRQDITEKTLNNSSKITDQNICSLNFHIFDKTDEKQNNVNLPIEAANKIYEKLEELKYLIMHKSRSDETQNLKIEFVDLLDTYGLLPAGLSKDYVLSLLNPSWIKNKQKTTKTKTILSKNYISPIAEKIVNLQEIFKNDFGKTILNIFDKNIILSPSGKTTATASFCSISSGGFGRTLPLFLLPRPRAIAVWTASDAITMVGELVTAKGFYAGGAQSGSMLGFTGMGLTYSLPGYIVYGFIGYALYTKVSADYIEFVNREPVISDENPPDGDYDVPVSLSKLSFRLSDLDGDLMNYTVTTEPNIGSGNGNNKKNGIYTVSISGLEGYTKYTWHVVVKDEYNTVEKYFTFTTEAVAPVVSDPLPPDKSKYIPINLSQLSFNLKDFQGDPMDYTVETSPNIGSSSGNDVGDGTYTCDVNGLDYQTEYTWYVNATDGAHWTHKVFNFQTEMKMIFDPFEEGWQYRKQITINHSMVAGDLVNFPVLISTIDTDLRDKAQDDGDDILFMNGSGISSRLYHEIELFDGSSGELVAWVNISDLSSSTDTIFYMYYGNPDCSDQECPELVWDTNHMLVYHMNDYTETMIKDVTYNENNGIKHGTTYPVESTGKIGFAQYFNGYVSCYMESSKDIAHSSNPWTYECWYKADSYPHSEDPYPTDPYSILFTTDTGASSHNLVIDIAPRNSKNRCRCYMDWEAANGYSYTENLNTFDNQWHHVVVVRDNTASEFKIFIDGSPDYTVVKSIKSGYTIQTAPLEIGAMHSYYPNRMYYEGFIDEIHVSKIVRSPQWISTSFNNQINPTSFVSFGPEESGL